MATAQDLGKCAHCNQDAKLVCKHCFGAPEYAVGDAKQTGYCGRECRTAHWPSHKPHCDSLWRRLILLRAARLLKAVLLAYRECVFDVDMSKIELDDDGVLQLHQRPRPASARKQYRLFPSELTDSLAHREAALMYQQDSTELAPLCHLTEHLLTYTGFASSGRILFLNIKKPVLRTQTGIEPNSNDCHHSAFKFKIRHATGVEEEWVLDPAGCRYGFRDVLVPFATYLQDTQGDMVREPEPYSWTETTDLDHFERDAGGNMTAAQRFDNAVERDIRRHYARFLSKRFGSAQPSAARDLLDWSSHTFRRELDLLTEDLKQYMILYMEKRGLYPIRG